MAVLLCKCTQSKSKSYGANGVVKGAVECFLRLADFYTLLSIAQHLKPSSAL